MNTSIDEIAPQTYRISTGVQTPDGFGFSFNCGLMSMMVIGPSSCGIAATSKR